MRNIIKAWAISCLLVILSFSGLTAYLSQYFTLSEFIIYLGEIICDDSIFKEFITFYIVIVIPFAFIFLCNEISAKICNFRNKNNN